MPKCGGSSFKELLKRRFPGKVLTDNDNPIHQSIDDRKKKVKRKRKWSEFSQKYLNRYSLTKCIHGHFLPHKYDFLYDKDETLFVTWLRDPVERLGSHYYFWQRTFKPWKSKPLHQKVIREDWSLEKFVFSEELRNLYSQFLWNFPIEKFDFIGIMEHYDEDLDYFGKNILSLNDFSVPQKNVNPNSSNKYFQDEKLIKDIKSFHFRDYEIYNYALQTRKERI